MKVAHRVKLIVVLLGMLFMANAVSAQDSLVTAAKTNVNWLIDLAKLNNAMKIIKSIEAKDFKAIAKKEDSTGVMIMYRNKAHEDCGLMVDKDYTKVTAVFFETRSLAMHNYMLNAIYEMGFKLYTNYKSESREIAYSLDNNLFIIKGDANDKQFTFASSLLVR